MGRDKVGRDKGATETEAKAATRSPDDLLDDRELSGVLKVAVPTLRNWRVLGRGPKFVRLGNSRMVRYRWSDIQAYIRVVEPRVSAPPRSNRQRHAARS